MIEYVDDLISTQNQIIFTQPLGFQEKSGGFFYGGSDFMIWEA